MWELTALPDPLAGFKGPTCKGMQGKETGEGEWREGKGGDGLGKGEEPTSKGREGM